jgi:predicted small secreted protein
MRKLPTTLLLASVATLSLGACNTVRGVGNYDPQRTYAACGTSAMDRDSNGRISNAEYNDYRTGAYATWDADRDGRISKAEYANCWYGGGFYNEYNRSQYQPSWTAFDANGDGYLSNEEYWNAQYYANLDKNGDGEIDRSEWPW